MLGCPDLESRQCKGGMESAIPAAMVQLQWSSCNGPAAMVQLLGQFSVVVS